MSRQVLESAQRYHARGWALVSMTAGSKFPGGSTAWGNTRYTEEQLPQHFGEHRNIGVLVGEPSNGLTDVDLDHEMSRSLAAQFLPPTELIHGLENNYEQSHYWYTTTIQELSTFRDPTDKAMLVELRASDGTDQRQTVIPPSLHPDGDVYAWFSEGTPARVADDVLKRAVGRLAAAALLAKNFPKNGRHNFCLALGAILLRGGWDTDEARDFVYAVAEAGGSDNPDARAETVGYTKSKLDAGEKVTGYPTFATFFNDHLSAGKIIDAMREWLELDRIEDDDDFLTESGLAETYALENAGKLIHVHESGWFSWNGKRWERDLGDSIVQRTVDAAVKSMVRQATKELNALAGGTIKEVLAMRKSKAKEEALEAFTDDVVARGEDLTRRIGVGMQMQTNAHLTSIVKMMGKFPAVRRSQVQLDSNPWLFNCDNGTLDLESGTLRPHDPGDLITKISPVAYDAKAKCPLFEKFLAEVQPDKSVREFLQVAHGYSLTGSTKEQCMFISQGTGSNGKSILDGVRRAVWGDYAMTADAATLMARNTDTIRNDIARLAGARLVLAPETESGRYLAETLVKQMTGGDLITSRFLYREAFEQAPTFKLWLSTNHRPQIKSTDNGIWRRLRLIPFDVVIPLERQDKNLEEKLKTEAAGVLAWCVRGLVKWKCNGLILPKVMQEAIDVYKRALDPIGEWFESELVSDPKGEIPTAELYASYSRYCVVTGTEPIAKHEFTEHLPHKGLVPKTVTQYMEDKAQTKADGSHPIRKLRVRGWVGASFSAK